MAYFAFGSAQQRFPVHAHAHEVEHLLLSDDVVSGCAFESGLQIGAKAWIGRRRQHRLAQVLQTMSSGVLDEFGKVQGMMDRAQLVMIDGFRTSLLHLLQLLLDQQAKGVARRPGFNDEAQERERPGDLFFGILDAPHMTEHHFPDHLAQMTAGQSVVADKGNSVRGEQLAAKGEQAISHGLRNPGIEAVRDDVIELPEFGTHIKEIALKQAHVGQCELANPRLAAFDRQAGQVESDEFAAGNGVAHGDEVSALIAGDFEHAAAIDRRRREPVQTRHDGQTVGMRIRVRKARV